LGEQQTFNQHRSRAAIDLKRRFITIICRIAIGSSDHLVGAPEQVGGMVGPSALTVLRVITILEFDGWLDRKLFGTGHNFVTSLAEPPLYCQ
jgi:hypothetical protein